MAFHTLFKVIIDLRIHYKTRNYEQAMGSHVLKTEDTDWCQGFACKELFRENLRLG
jgi:hypothetical protein